MTTGERIAVLETKMDAMEAAMKNLAKEVRDWIRNNGRPSRGKMIAIRSQQILLAGSLVTLILKVAEVF